MIFSLLLPVISMVFRFFTAKSSNDAQQAIAALNATVEEHKSARAERTALMAPWAYTVLILLIVGPPAVHWAAVFCDTTFSFISWAVPKAPEPYATYEFQMLFGFVGIGGIGTAAVSVVRRIWR